MAVNDRTNRDDLGEGVIEHELKADVHVFTGFHMTDTGNAERLIALYGDEILYCKALGSWLLWDNTRWFKDEEDAIMELAKATVNLIHVEVGLMPNTTKYEKAQRQELSNWAFRSESEQRLRAMIKLAQSDDRVSVTLSELDADRHLLNCPNGTIDFKECVFREHRREDKITKITRVPYVPDARSELFYRVLLASLGIEKAIYLQRGLGSNLEYTTKNKEAFVVYGAHYAAKSSITQCLYGALGEYARTFPIELLKKSKHGVKPNAARPELAALRGVRLAWSEEMDEGFQINDRMLKALTSSGVIYLRDVYEKGRNEVLGCTFVLESNSAPTFHISDEEQLQAALERVLICPFTHTIPKEERDRDIFKRLSEDEQEQTVALAWAVQGFFDRAKYGLPIPTSVKEGTEEYEREVNPLAAFIREEVVLDDGKTKDGIQREVQYVSIEELMGRYRGFAGYAAASEMTPRSFSVLFMRGIKPYAEKEGITVKRDRKNGGRVFHNVRLRGDDDRPLVSLHGVSIHTEVAEVGGALEKESVESMTQNDANDAKTQNGVNPPCTIREYIGLYTNSGFCDICDKNYSPIFPTILVEGVEIPRFDVKPQNEELENLTQNDAKFSTDEQDPQEIRGHNGHDTSDSRLKPIDGLMHSFLNGYRQTGRRDYTEDGLRDAFCEYAAGFGHTDSAYVAKRYDDELAISDDLDFIVIELTKEASGDA